MTSLAWPDLSPLRMAAVPVSGLQPGNAVVLHNGETLPELAEAFGFRPYRGRYVLRRGLTDPDFQASGHALGAAVAFILPDLPFRGIDPVALAYRHGEGPLDLAEAAERLAEAMESAPPAAGPVAAQADAKATRRFRTLPLTPPGALIADAVAFAKPDPFAVAALTGTSQGSFAFLLSQSYAAIGSHDPASAELRICAVDGSETTAIWFSKAVTGGAATFAVGTPDGTRTYPSRVLATRHVREAVMQAMAGPALSVAGAPGR